MRDTGHDAAATPHGSTNDAGVRDAGAVDASVSAAADAGTTCEVSCEATHLTWSDGPPGAESYALDDCRDFTRKPGADAGGDSGACATALPCTGSDSLDTLPSRHALESALADPEIQSALARDAKFGFDVPSAMFALEAHGGSIRIYDTPCDFRPADVPDDAAVCEDAPAAVRALRILLDRIAAHSTCARSMQDPTCALEFDRGDGSSNLAAYTFDARTGTCEPTIYSGHGGNANRFDSLELCRASCPTTARPSSCEQAHRTFVIESCLTCGFGGGCMGYAPMCARPCTTYDDCAGEHGNFCSARHVCEVGGCL